MIIKNIDWITKEKRYDLPTTITAPDEIQKEQIRDWLYAEYAIPVAGFDVA